MRPIYELNDAIVDNDGPALIRALMKNPNIKQNDLDECFARAMPRASGSIIKILIERGAQLNSKSYRLAMTRTRCEGSTIINILRDYGFDIDTAEFGRTPVQ